jgi:hypothetical protein
VLGMNAGTRHFRHFEHESLLFTAL